MSRLWNRPRLRVYLGDGQLATCSVSGGRRARLLDHERFDFERGGLLSAIAGLGAGLPLQGSQPSLEFILGTAHVRYLLLPWDAGLHEERVRDRLAATLFTRTFQDDPARYDVQFSPAAFGQAQLAAFVDKDLLGALRGLAARAGGGLRSVEPLLAAVWNAHRRRLGRRQGTLLLAEGERLLMLRHSGPRFHQLQLRPCKPGELGNQVNHLSTSAPVSLFAPLHAELAATAPAAWLAPDGLASGAVATEAWNAFALCGVSS